VGALVDSSTTGALYRSRDGGATFESIAGPPHIRALSQRGGTVYAATDNFGDGYALAVSNDEGATWHAAMAYDQIQAILGCVRSDPQCQARCQALAGQGAMSPGMIWESAVCSANPPPEPLPEPPVIAGGGGCGCTTAPAASTRALVLIGAIAVAIGARRRRTPRR